MGIGIDWGKSNGNNTVISILDGEGNVKHSSQWGSVSISTEEDATACVESEKTNEDFYEEELRRKQEWEEAEHKARNEEARKAQEELEKRVCHACKQNLPLFIQYPGHRQYNTFKISRSSVIQIDGQEGGFDVGGDSEICEDCYRKVFK